MINDMKKSIDTKITQLENGQAVMGNVMKAWKVFKIPWELA